MSVLCSRVPVTALALAAGMLASAFSGAAAARDVETAAYSGQAVMEDERTSNKEPADYAMTISQTEMVKALIDRLNKAYADFGDARNGGRIAFFPDGRLTGPGFDPLENYEPLLKGNTNLGNGFERPDISGSTIDQFAEVMAENEPGPYFVTTATNRYFTFTKAFCPVLVDFNPQDDAMTDAANLFGLGIIPEDTDVTFTKEELLEFRAHLRAAFCANPGLSKTFVHMTQWWARPAPEEIHRTVSEAMGFASAMTTVTHPGFSEKAAEFFKALDQHDIVPTYWARLSSIRMHPEDTVFMRSEAVPANYFPAKVLAFIAVNTPDNTSADSAMKVAQQAVRADTLTGEEIVRRIQVGSDDHAVRFSPNGTYLARWRAPSSQYY